MLNDRRMGRFTITLERIEEQPDKVIALLHGVIIVEATTRWDTRSIEYLGISDKFEKTEIATSANLYYVVNDGERLRFERERFPRKESSNGDPIQKRRGRPH